MDSPNVKSHNEAKKRMADVLVGTLCYYPGNSDFYFCGYDKFLLKSTTTKNDIVHKIICQLCGIAEDSPAGVLLKAKLHGEKGGILEYGEQKTDDYTTDTFGKQPGDSVEYCIRLNNPRLTSKLKLSFLQPHHKISQAAKRKSDGEFKYDDHGNRIYEVYSDKTTVENVPICEIDSKPSTLDGSDFFKLLDVGTASVFLDDYTNVRGSDNLGSRSLTNNYESAITNGRAMFNFVRNHWANKEWTKFDKSNQIT